MCVHRVWVLESLGVRIGGVLRIAVCLSFPFQFLEGKGEEEKWLTMMVLADYKIYEHVVNATHRLKPIFYDE